MTALINTGRAELQLSLVVPIYNEEESIPHLVREVHEALDPTGLTWELICVDDGSTDNSFDVLTRISETDRHLVVGQFRRNFGQTAAMQAGIDVSRGDVVVTMDADLQNDPKDIPGMLAKLDEGFDMVAGWRSSRKDTFLNRRLPSTIANRLISSTTKVRLHDYGCTLKAFHRDIAKEMRLYGEMHRFIPAVASLIGARVAEVPVNHRARKFGSSKYGIGRTLRVVLDLLTVLFLRSYLARPMQVFGSWGVFSFLAGVAVCSYLAVMKFAYGQSLAERPLLLFGTLLIILGIQLLSLGLIADLLGRTYHESQGKRPYYMRRWCRQGQVTRAVDA